MAWSFLVDENTRKQAVAELENDYTVEHVVEVLWPGADDFNDILPYARAHDRVIITKNYRDFNPGVGHCGIIIADDLHQPDEIADGVTEIVQQYPSRQSFQDRVEWLAIGFEWADCFATRFRSIHQMYDLEFKHRGRRIE